MSPDAWDVEGSVCWADSPSFFFPPSKTEPPPALTPAAPDAEGAPCADAEDSPASRDSDPRPRSTFSPCLFFFFPPLRVTQTANYFKIFIQFTY